MHMWVTVQLCDTCKELYRAVQAGSPQRTVGEKNSRWKKEFLSSNTSQYIWQTEKQEEEEEKTGKKKTVPVVCEIIFNKGL